MNTTLSPTDFASLSPLLIVLAGALFLLLLESFAATAAKKFSALCSLIFLSAALYAACDAPASSNLLLTRWLRFDTLARLFTVFFLAVGFGTTLLASTFFRHRQTSRGEYYFLLLSAVFGLILVGAAADFLTLFIGIETLSISLYILCSYMKKWTTAAEAGMKYFFMGAISAAFLLYGIALVYGALGTTSFDGLRLGHLTLSSSSDHTLFLSGIALITLGLAFKAAIVPFHVWAPDVYDGAPLPVTAFMATGTKIGAFAAFAVVFLVSLPNFNPVWNKGIAFLAILTLVYANYVALRQVSLRRFFAYSGISHAGFLLIPLAAGTPDALSALVFYLVVYSFATLGAFAVLALLDVRNEGIMLYDLNGLFKRSPLLAGALALCLLTLAGIPPTVGFFAKFYVFKTAVEAGLYPLVIVALLTTILSAYYYMRMVAVMLTILPTDEKAPAYSLPAAVVSVVSVAAILLLSIYPAPVMELLALATRD